jgi:hypothetical protein
MNPDCGSKPNPQSVKQEEYSDRSVRITGFDLNPVFSAGEREYVKQKSRRFQALVREARAGNPNAQQRLAQHIQRRLRAGWSVRTVTERLGVSQEQVLTTDIRNSKMRGAD